MKIITPENFVMRNEKRVVTTELGDELVMMDLESGSYISLNKTGNVIWQELGKPIQVKELIQNLVKRFNIDEQQCTTDTMEFLEKMYEEHALTVQ